jgi:hypothetical protein
LALVAHQRMMLASPKEMLVQTQYLAPSLLMAAAVEDEGAALTEQAAMVALVVAVALILELVERQPLGRAIMAELRQAQCLPYQTTDAVVVVAREGLVVLGLPRLEVTEAQELYLVLLALA